MQGIVMRSIAKLHPNTAKCSQVKYTLARLSQAQQRYIPTKRSIDMSTKVKPTIVKKSKVISKQSTDEFSKEQTN